MTAQFSVEEQWRLIYARDERTAFIQARTLIICRGQDEYCKKRLKSESNAEVAVLGRWVSLRQKVKVYECCEPAVKQQWVEQRTGVVK